MGKILIADDVEESRYYLEALLKGHGHVVLAARNGADALAMAQTEGPDLIVSDILMPVLDGFDFCRECKKDARLAAIPFVFYTATYLDPKDRVFGLSLGADEYLIKPLEPDCLMAALYETIVRKTRSQSEQGRIHLENDSVYLQGHKEILIRKLEDKMLQLEEVNRRLAEELSVRRQAETRLRLLYAAIENWGECVIISNSEGVVEYVNPAFEKTMDIPKEEILGKSLTSLSGCKHGSFFGDLLANASSGSPWKGRLTSKGKDGEPVEFAATISPIGDVSGRTTGYVSMMQDVTVQRRLEDQLFQAQKMEAIGTLAGGIAHDFNNILSIIIGYTDLALYHSIQGSQIWNNLKIVLDTADRARDLVKQILTFSRKAERTQARVNLRGLVEECLKLLQAALPATIEIKTSYESDGEVVVQGDPIQIQQVILNIATNAAHSMGNKGGSMEFVLKTAEVAPDRPRQHLDLAPGEYALLSVRDTGCGMDDATVARIFEPFFTTKGKGEGTGLGLSVAHGIVQSHGGLITVRSKVGRGSTFSVYLPVAEGAAEGRESAATSLFPGGGERILFIDDEKYLGEAGRQILERFGYRVTAIASSSDALKLFQSKPDDFDLVITDQTMPHMTGVELAGELLGIRPDLPIILCTGFGIGALGEEAKAMGIRRILMKPLMMKDVARTIRSVLDEVSEGASIASSA